MTPIFLPWYHGVNMTPNPITVFLYFLRSLVIFSAVATLLPLLVFSENFIFYSCWGHIDPMVLFKKLNLFCFAKYLLIVLTLLC